MADFYGGNDLIFEHTGGSIIAGGYNITSPMINNLVGGGKHLEKDKPNKNEDKNEDNYLNHVIPIGLINFNVKNKHTFNILNSSDILSHDLYDNLLNMVNIDSKPLHNITKKNNLSTKSKTKKHKK